MIINTSVSKISGGSCNLQDKSVTPTESTQTITADVGYDGLNEVVVAAISNTYIGSAIPQNTSADLVVSGDTVTAPSGYYSANASASVASGSATTPTTTITPGISAGVRTDGVVEINVGGSQSITPTVTAGYVSAGTAGTVSVSGTSSFALDTVSGSTVTPTESVQTAVPEYYFTTGDVIVDAIPSNYIGSGVTQNTSADLVVSGDTVTAPSGYYANNASASVASGSATTPATTITANPSISVSASGLITATASASQSITPQVTAGYVSSGTAGTVSVSGSNTQQLTTRGATTYSPQNTAQTIPSGIYLIGNQTIAPATKTNKSITANGTYDPSNENLYGYDVVTVNVPNPDFIVTLSWDSVAEQWEPNKTFAEIQQAYSDGLTITVDTDQSPIDVSADGEYDSIDQAFYYTVREWSNSSGFSEITESYYHMDSIDGVVLDDQYTYIDPIFETVTKTYYPSEYVQTETVTYDSTNYNGLQEVDVTVNAVPNNYVGSAIDWRDSTDLSASGATVSVPSGYYEYSETYTIPSGTVVPQSSITESGATVSPGNNTITLQKNNVSNTPNVTTAGYISSGTVGNTDISLSANVPTLDATTYAPSTTTRTIASGTYIKGTQTISPAPKSNKTITANGVYDPANESLYGYDVVTVNVPPSSISLQTKTATYTPTTSQQTDTITADVGYDGLQEVDVTVNAMPMGTVRVYDATLSVLPTISVDASGLITASVSDSMSVGASVNAGYVNSAISGTFATNGSNTQQLSTQGATTIIPSATQQTAVAAGKFTTSAVVVDPIPSQYIIPTGSMTITSNGSNIDIAQYATVDVNVPSSTATKTSESLSSTTTTLSISGLSGRPVMWALQNVVSNGSYFSGASTRYITSCLCSGGSTVYSLCIYKSGSTARMYGYNTVTWSYNNNGTITITSPGTSTAGGFRTGSTYRLFYAY